MKVLSILTLSMIMLHANVLFDFTKDCAIDQWRSVDDVVMGGRSSGNLMINEDGHGVFHGTVSLANNGGFSMIQYSFDKQSVENFSTVNLRIKGDGKKYQFRVKAKNSDYYSYNYAFSISGEWETITIPLAKMKPAFRGRALDIPDFDQPQMEQIAFLIGNKKPQEFKLVIDKIELQ